MHSDLYRIILLSLPQSPPLIDLSLSSVNRSGRREKERKKRIRERRKGNRTEEQKYVVIKYSFESKDSRGKVFRGKEFGRKKGRKEERKEGKTVGKDKIHIYTGVSLVTSSSLVISRFYFLGKVQLLLLSPLVVENFR